MNAPSALPEGEPVAASGAAARVYAGFGIVVGIPAAIWIAAVAREPGGWLAMALVGLVVGGAVASIRALRLEVFPTALRYRTLGGERRIGFSQVRHAGFVPVRSALLPFAPRRFALELTGGAKQPIAIRAFPPGPVRALFAGLVRHGVRIDVPDAWRARYIDAVGR